MHFNNKFIYQIYPKSFLDTTGSGVGDIQGIIQKLPYIKDLGVDYIWLCPIMKSPQNDNGYDISDYYTIDEMFGTNKDYEELLSKANAIGLKVIMDLVLNHTSTNHIWFQKAINGETKYQEYYIFREQPTELLSVFGGSAWEYVPSLNKYYLHMFDKTQADLNWENAALREELYTMINYWIEKGVGGFRLDVIDMIGKNIETNEISRTPRFYELLEELNEKTFKDKLFTVGECWGASIEEASKMCTDKGLTQVFHFEDMMVTNGQTKWEQVPLSLQKLSYVFEKWNNEYSGINAWVIGNHDSPRTLTKWFNNTSYREEAAKLIITLYAMLRGNIYIYQGDEIGMTNYVSLKPDDYRDIEAINAYNELIQTMEEETAMQMVANMSRDNARMPFEWNSQKNAGFTTGTPWIKTNVNYASVNMESDLARESSIYHYYQKVIRFRKEYKYQIESKLNTHVHDNVLILEKDELVGIYNFTATSVPYTYDKGQLLISNYNTTSQYLRPFECRIIKK